MSRKQIVFYSGLVFVTLIVGMLFYRHAHALTAAWRFTFEHKEIDHLLTHPDGSVSAMDCEGRAASKNIATTGNLLGQIPQENLGNCHVPPAVDKNGTLYAAKGTSSIAAYSQSGTKKWEYSLDFATDSPGCNYHTPSHIMLGGNGNIYVGTKRESPWCPEKSFFVVLSPEGKALSIQPAGEHQIGFMGLHQAGIVAATDYGGVFGLHYFDLEGKNLKYVNLGEDTWGAYNFTNDAEGRVFISIRAQPEPEKCSAKLVTIRIATYTQDGRSGRYELPECTSVYSMASGPWGVGALTRHQALAADNDHLITLRNDGLLLHNLSLSPEEGGRRFTTPYQEPEILGDTKGNLFLRRYYYPTLADNSSGPLASLITVLDPLTGQPRHTLDSKELSIGPGGSLLHGGMAIAENKFYFLDSDAEKSQLHSIIVPGIGLDYPRGALIQTTSPPTPPPKPKLKYVALGDSFSSGEGVEPFLAGTDTKQNRCHRSIDSYPQQLVKDLKIRDHLSLTDFKACSGATTDKLYKPWTKNNEKAQIDALNKNIDIVSLSIGGNDTGFALFAGSCVVLNCNLAEAYVTYRIERALPGNLDKAYTAVKGKVKKEAKIYVLGYPHIVPDKVPANKYCEFNIFNRQSARRIVSKMDRKIGEATKRTGSQFTFKDPTAAGSPFIGHELCQPDPYFNSLLTPKEFSYHPNYFGQKAYKDFLVKDIANRIK